MLNKLDDYPIHQTPEPLAHPQSTDRNVYDRFWFNGYSGDGGYYFGVAMGLYPHRGILDCGFSVVTQGGRQHCFYASRRAPTERTEMQVGPFRLEVVEPMRRMRLVIDDNESGLACDLTFSGRSASIQESRQTLWSGPRRVMDNTRFDQFGRWSGRWCATFDGEIRIDPAECYGTRGPLLGRARGGRTRETGSAALRPARRLLPVDAAVLGRPCHQRHLLRRHAGGRPLVREGITAPLYPSEERPCPASRTGAIERMATVPPPPEIPPGHAPGQHRRGRRDRPRRDRPHPSP